MSSRRSLSANLLLALLGIALLGHDAQAQAINWRTNLDGAKLEASRTGKLVLMHFYTSSCGPCKKLERDVFSQPQIGAALERDYVPIKLNADENPALANAFQITRVPTEVVLNSQGSIVQKLSCPLEPNAYGAQLVNVAEHYRDRAAQSVGSRQTPVHSAYAGLKIGQYKSASTASAVAPANKAPIAPAVTTNPYVAAAAPVVQQKSNAAVVPANAMPNSYRNRYAAVSAPAQVGVSASATPPFAPPTAPGVAVAPTTVAAPLAITAAPTNLSLANVPQVAAPPLVSASQNTASPVAAGVVPNGAPPVVAAGVPQNAAPPIVGVPENTPPRIVDAWPPQLPPNTPPLAFDGHCPVSLQQLEKWVRGKQSIGAFHRGRTYLFAGESQRQKFLAAPDAYSPVFSGNDPVKLLDDNQEVAGSRNFGFEYRGAFYLFASKETMTRFASRPDHYSAGVRQAMNRMDAAGGGTLRR